MKKAIIFLALAAVTLSSCCQAPKKAKVLAHRGVCWANQERITDENTLDALRRAQELKVDAVEFDVHLTADDSLVIRHDDKIDKGLSCQKSTYEEIRAYTLPFGNQIPSLREWLTQAKQTPEIPILIELKKHSNNEREFLCVQKVVDMVREFDMLDQAWFLSFKPETCDEFIRVEPSAKIIFNDSNVHSTYDPDFCAEHGYKAVSYNCQELLNHPQWVARAHELGMEVYFWMVNDPYVREIAEKLGSDWVTTDYYDIIHN